MRILKLLTRCSLEQSALNAIVVDFSLLLAPSRCPLSNCWVCRRVSIVHVAFDAVSPKTRPATCLLLLQAQLLVPVIPFPPLPRVQYVYLILSSEGAPQLTLCNDPFSMVQ